jgi:hypothetical protein
MASSAPPIVHPTAPVGAVFFIILMLSDSGAAKEVVSLASSGHEKARSASFQAAFRTPFRRLPPFELPACPPLPLPGGQGQHPDPP